MSPDADLERLEDMRAALADIRALTDREKDAFLADRTAQQAAAYNLAVLGEAARAISNEFREAHPELPWSDLIGQRNVVIHEYHRLDLDAIWAVAVADVPQLKKQLDEIVLTEGEEAEEQS